MVRNQIIIFIGTLSQIITRNKWFYFLYLYFTFVYIFQISNTTVKDELEAWDLEDIFPIFVKKGITQSIMWEFTKEELEEIGVGIVQRKRYFHAVEQIKKRDDPKR